MEGNDEGPQGEGILLTSKARMLYRYDVASGQPLQVASPIAGQGFKSFWGVRSASTASGSSARNNGGVAANCYAMCAENGHILICDSRTNHLVRTVKMNAASRGLDFHPGCGSNGNTQLLYSCDREGFLYEWDLRNGRCRDRFRDENCVELSSLKCSMNKQTGKTVLAAGTTSGTVDLFDITSGFDNLFDTFIIL